MSLVTSNAKASAAPSGGGVFVPLSELEAGRPVDLEQIREKLRSAEGPVYWRSLEELADTPELRAYVEREFPHAAPRDWAPLGRREFVRLMGATLALAGVSGCGYQPAEKIVPYVVQPETVIPGKPRFYATAYTRGGYGYGLLGESHVGRPIKLEGNPDHPASLGATDVFAQASLLHLYDPDRSQAVRNLGDTTDWETFQTELSFVMEQALARRGAGVRVVTGAFTSPTLVDQFQRALKRFPLMRVCIHEPAGREQVHAGVRLAFGRDLQPVYHFDRATRILALDSDFLTDEPGSVRYAREFADARRVTPARLEMSRLYSIESTPSLTGAAAEHRAVVRPSQVEAAARAVLAGLSGGAFPLPAGLDQSFVAALVRDLKEHPGECLVIAGPGQTPTVHALAFAMNQVLGGIGRTITLHEPVEASFGSQQISLEDLAGELEAGSVDLLIFLDTNPVYTAPADLDFRARVERARLRVYAGLYEDETSVLCHWHLPMAHYLEAWSDVRAFDGTASIVQPLIRPLYGSRSLHEIVEALFGKEERPGYDLVRGYWEKRWGGGPSAARAWSQALVNGRIPGTEAQQVPATAQTTVPGTAPAPGEGMEIVFRPDPTIGDGSFSNNPWMQELPKPLSVLTWDNAAYIAPATREFLRLRNGDMIEVTYEGRTLEVPVWEVPGQPLDTLTLTLGYGRTHAGKIGNGAGFNAYALRTAAHPGFGTGVQVRKTGRRYQLAGAQHHFRMEGRDLVRMGTLAEYAQDPKDPHFMHTHHGHGDRNPSLYNQDWPSDRAAETDGTVSIRDPAVYKAAGYNSQPIPAWGMVIDLNACIGCNACTVACQAENNIATVGKDQVLVNREMHWLRIDTYYEGGFDNPQTVFQPVACQHCEKAPCEPVCPVSATTHSVEGVNEMTYNRCIGTRYCSNNCPYKVRRFNFLQFQDMQTPSIQLMRNPDVTVRARGVMEKCTYCIQRINGVRIEAEKEERVIRDGDILTACQQVCPTRAITFGDINDRQSRGGQGSRVRELKQDPRNYGILTELNTFPRTSYLARLRNPNPALAGGGHGESAGEGGHEAEAPPAGGASGH